MASTGAARPGLLAGLACPGCARPLTATAAREGGPATTLACAACHRRWPVRQRTPAFLPPALLTAVPTGPVTLLHAPDVEHWDGVRHSLERADPRLCAEVFDVSRDDWLFLLPLPPEARVLVLGSGWARLAASLAGLCGRVYAVDPDHARARFANARAFAEGHPNLLGIQARLGVLPFAPESLDLVVLTDVAALGPGDPWRHLPANLVRLRSLLAPRGRLLLRGEPAAGRWAGRLRLNHWRRLLYQAGFSRVDDLLALPDCGTNSYVLQMGPEVPPPRALAAYARHYLEPKTLARRLAGGWLRSGRAVGAAEWLFSSHWLLAGNQPSLETPVLEQSGLSSGAWGVLAARSRPYRGARAHFAAFDPGTARVHFLVKVARDASAEAVVASEHQMLVRLQESLSPDLRATVPAPLDRFAVHGHPAAAQSHLDGRTLARILQETPAWRRPRVAARLLTAAAEWLSRFHQETARPVVMSDEWLERLALSELRRCAEECARSTRERHLLEELAAATARLAGQRLPLVCEHRDFWAKNILLDRDTVRVVDWDLAQFDRLPLGDLYALIHSLAFILVGDPGDLTRAEPMLHLAYGGTGLFSQAVDAVIGRYRAGLGIPPEWGRLLLPLSVARQALLHAEHFHSGMDARWLEVAVCYLGAPDRFPAAVGHSDREAPRGR